MPSKSSTNKRYSFGTAKLGGELGYATRHNPELGIMTQLMAAHFQSGFPGVVLHAFLDRAHRYGIALATPLIHYEQPFGSWDPKEKKPKAASLLEEDIELLKSIPRGLPGLFFFRHPAGLSGARAGERFGNRYLYKYWKKACANLGIEGIDLYGGTRHSTVTALSEHLTPEQIKAGTLHSTNKAFERYFRAQTTTSKLVYETARQMQSFQKVT